ncbi:MAG: S41 family peptidase [Polyangia bacterium]
MKNLVALGLLVLGAGCGGSNHPVDDGGVGDAAIAGDAGCTDDGGCGAKQAGQALLVHEYADAFQAGTACAAPIDWTALANGAAQTVLDGDGSSAVLYRAMRSIQLGVPEGHQELFYPGCGDEGSTPYQESTWYGVCGRPHGNAVVVTQARSGNTLGLAVGDQIVGTSRWTAGATFFDQIAKEPVCGSSMPSVGAQHENAAASLFGLVRAGDTLTVQDVGGTLRTVTAPTHDAMSAWCIAPFGGVDDFEAKAMTRGDGVVVIRVPGFLSSAHPLPDPATQASYAQWVSDYVARLATTLDGVKDAPAIVWDARSNTGGSPEVALAIVAGMPGAKAGVLSKGFRRVEGSDPFAYQPAPIASYSFNATVGGPLAYGGKVAVLIDGLTYSAGDFFAYAVHHFSGALLVGRPSAGAFGYGGSASVTIGTPPEFAYTVDFMKSVDDQGVPLEANEVMPDLVVEYDPADLAAGRDTVLEAAVSALLK